MALLQIPIKLMCAQGDPWVPEDYIQQYKAACGTPTCSIVVSSNLSHRLPPTS
jgi:hypothetical protein